MRATSRVNITPGGAASGVVAAALLTPPAGIAPKVDQGWWVVVSNPTVLSLEVSDAQGSKWVPPYVADVFGTNCDPITPLGITWYDLAGPTAGTVTLLLSWCIAPDSYGPGSAAYPSDVG